MGAVGDDLHSVVIFRLSGQLFAIPVADVREVVPYAWLGQPPRMPAFVHGVLNLGGLAVPVLRLDKLLGTPAAVIGLEASILIMKGTDTPLGLLVEHVEGVRAAAEFQCSPLDDRQSFQGCLAGQLQDATGLTVHLLSWRAVLLAEEAQRLSHFQQSAQHRLAELAEGEA